jgi:hypothetical protein
MTLYNANSEYIRTWLKVDSIPVDTICKKLQSSERIIVLDTSVISCGRMVYFIYPERK